MTSPICSWYSLRHALFVVSMLTGGNALAQDRPADPALADALRDLQPFAHSGVLLDRVLPLARIEALDGSASTPVVSAARWRQAFDELHRASISRTARPDLAALDTRARALLRDGVLPIVWLDRAYEHVRPEALTDGSMRMSEGRLQSSGGTPLVSARAVAAAVLAPATFRGAELVFALDPVCFVSDDSGPPRAISIDFADGRGPRSVALAELVSVHYRETGTHTIDVHVTRSDGSSAVARFAIEVAALVTPLPDDTLHITATIPYLGSYGTGDAYVALAPGHASIVNPIIVVEGFDLENNMNWDELYTLLNQQNLIETLRSDGFDAVVLNFSDATDAIQKNAFVVAELIQQVQAQVSPLTSVAVVGASMGGLCSRYALAYMENRSLPHRVRTWLSFDGPQAGADIPLGLQHWIRFFAGQSVDAAAFLALLDRPAARQMLLYHYTNPAGTTGTADPLRTQLLTELTSLGDYPSLPRRLAVANGSGTGANQGFAPRAQVIRYEYSSLFASLTGNVWALPDQVSGTIFQGSIRILLSTTSQTVTVNNTKPWDGAPGGTRASFAELDATTAPYGDIVALHPSHCFIPTVSALALATSDPFFNVAAAVDPLALTPFDAIYHPSVNEEHVSLSPASAAWIRAELEQGLVDAPAPSVSHAVLRLSATPSPFAMSTRLDLVLPRAARVDLSVYGVDGRQVRRLLGEARPAGAHTVWWDGRDSRGGTAPPGLYFVRCLAGTEITGRRLVKLD